MAQFVKKNRNRFVVLPRRGQTKIESTLNLLSDMLNVAHLPLPVSPDGRLPTFAEVTGFDAASAWAPPYARATSVSRRARCPLRSGQWPAQLPAQLHNNEPREIEVLESAAFTDFLDKSEPLWADLYGWRTN